MDVINKLKQINLKNKVKAIIEGENKTPSTNKEENQKNNEILSEYIIHLCKESPDMNTFKKSLEGEFSEKIIYRIYNTIKGAKLYLSNENNIYGEEKKVNITEKNNIKDNSIETLTNKTKFFNRLDSTIDDTELSKPKIEKKEKNVGNSDELNLFFEEEYRGRYFRNRASDGYIPIKIEQPPQNFSEVLSAVDNNDDSEANLMNRKRLREERKAHKLNTEVNIVTKVEKLPQKMKNKNSVFKDSLIDDIDYMNPERRIYDNTIDDSANNIFLPPEIKKGRIFDATVTKVIELGCFVDIFLDTIKKVKDKDKKVTPKPFDSRRTCKGFVPISHLKSYHHTQLKIKTARQIVTVGDRVKVKIVSLEEGRLIVSTNQVDQKTGEDIMIKQNKVQRELTKIEDEKIKLFFDKNVEEEIPGVGALTGIPLRINEEEEQDCGEYEIWEMLQMKNAGRKDYHVENYNTKIVNQDVNDSEKDLNIELREEEPPFLKGMTSKTNQKISTISLVKCPEGVMQKSIKDRNEQARLRKEIRDKHNKDRIINMKRTAENMIGMTSELKDQDILKMRSGFLNDKDLKYLKFDTDNKKILKGVDEEMPKKILENRKKINDFKLKKKYLTIREQRESLPIFQYKEELRKKIGSNRIIIIVGETGSGKTTQLTQYLAEWGYAKYGRIGCTQPRRVAAMSVAMRVSLEFGCKLKEEVGYLIRFEDKCSEKTIIKYMTEGMLLRETLLDKNLTQYSVIILDEAHERTIATDVLFGLIKEAIRNRPTLKLIITSATLNSVKFSRFFDDCPVFKIPGRTYDVEILYAKVPEVDYLEASLKTVLQIHLNEKPGDILLFLTGQEEIDNAVSMLQLKVNTLGKNAPKMIVLPVYSALPSELQIKIFEPAPPGTRKCIIATNIAEASLTIDGIYYVVDPGFTKIKTFNSKMGMDNLIIIPISQSSAQQRAGRAGRTGPGKCYRLYTYNAFKNEMLPDTIPEIQRTNLADTVLILKALGINDLLNFEFMDPPPTPNLVSAMEQLFYLGALDEEGLLTKLGRRMAEFPLEPQLSKMLLASVDLNCSEEITTIVSMLSVQNIFYRPKDKEELADKKRAQFINYQGDHITLLNLYNAYIKVQTEEWCQQNFVHYRSLSKAVEIKEQLKYILERYKLKMISCKGSYSQVRKAITAGYFSHIARCQKDTYKTIVDDHEVYIHPSSALFNKNPEWVVYHEVINTSKEYMRNVSTINPKWLMDVAGKYFKICDPNVLTKKQRNEKIECWAVRFGDPNEWRISKRKGFL